jgi:hypothetical protein
MAAVGLVEAPLHTQVELRVAAADLDYCLGRGSSLFALELRQGQQKQ